MQIIAQPKAPYFSFVIRRPSRLALTLCGAVILALWAPLLLLYSRAFFASDVRALLFNALVFFRLTLSSLVLSVLTACASTILGVPLGFIIARGPRRARALVAALTALPLGVPAVLAAAPFFSLGGPENYPLWACAGALALVYFPVVSFATAAALAALPREEEEAARALCSPFEAWSGVLGRRILPAIGAAAGVVAALCLWEMGAPDLLSYPTLSSEIYRQLNSPTALGDANVRAALTAWPVPVLALFFLWPALRIATQWSAPASQTNAARSRGLLVWALLLLVSPGFLVWQFARELDDPRAIFDTLAANTDALWNTLFVATCAATICVALALALCLTWRNWPSRARNIALMLTLAPGLSASVVVGVSLIEAFNRPLTGALYDSAYGMTIWGDCARFLPLCIAILWGAVARLPAESLWAAAGVGASPLRAATGIALPLLRGAIVGAWGLVWAWSAGELTVTVLVHGPGGDTLPIPIFNFLHAGIASDVAALCLLLMALCGGAMICALGVLRSGRS